MRNELIAAPLESWARTSIARIGRNVERLQDRRKRKLLVVHLDGVPHELLRDAVERNTMPFFASLVRSGQYQLDSAFWGSPASTPCFQAGLLYGVRHPNLPAYSWFDRELGRKVAMNFPRDAAVIESRLGLATRSSLMEGGGTVYLSLFDGNASNLFCMTALSNIKRLGRSMRANLGGIRGGKRQGVFSYLRELVRDTWATTVDVFQWARRIDDWRHEWQYWANRIFMINLAWDLAHSRALVDMVRGVPSLYMVYGNYDEIAHRRGPRSPQALAELYRVDNYLAELYAVARTLEEPYDIYFVTDHGHVDSAPIESRIGRKVERYLTEGPPEVVPQSLAEALLMGRYPRPPDRVQYEDEPVIVESGNFAHVYLSRGEPLEAAELLRRFPSVLARAARQRDIGIVALRRGDSGAAMIQGKLYGPEEISRAPLSTEFSKRAVADLLRELPHMKTAGDLVLYGEIFQPGGTVGFAWEFGSHGGLTEIETQSTVCWPTSAPLTFSGLSHCTQLHERLSEIYRA
jgi:hypothetical protein